MASNPSIYNDPKIWQDFYTGPAQYSSQDKRLLGGLKSGQMPITWNQMGDNPAPSPELIGLQGANSQIPLTAGPENNPNPGPTSQQDINIAANQGAGSSPPSGFNMGGFEPYYKNPEYLNLIKQWEASRGDAVAAQKAGLAGLEQRNQQYQNQPLQLDLSPLMALNDQWFGGNMGKEYKRPESPTDRVKALSDMENALLKARGGISQEEQQYLQNRMGLMQKGDETKANLMIAQAKIQEAQNVTNEQRGIKNDRKLIEQVRQLGTSVGDSLPAIQSNIALIKSIIPEVDSDPNTVHSIPGLGVSATLPEFMKSPKGQQLSQATKGLVSQVLMMQSGKTVSEQERDSKMKEMGLTAQSTPRQFIQGFHNLQNMLVDVMRSKEAGYMPEAVNVYKQQGGLTHEVFQSTSPFTMTEDQLNAELKKKGLAH